MKNSEVAEMFASSDSTRAKTKTMFIEDKSIYSWGRHFKIAEKIGDNVALFNTDSYSSSTGKHKHYTLNSLLNRGFKVIEIMNCDINNLGKQYKYNNNTIDELYNKKTRNKNTTRQKIDKINKLKEQNALLIDLAIKNGIMVEAI